MVCFWLVCILNCFWLFVWYFSCLFLLYVILIGDSFVCVVGYVGLPFVCLGLLCLYFGYLPFAWVLLVLWVQAFVFVCCCWCLVFVFSLIVCFGVIDFSLFGLVCFILHFCLWFYLRWGDGLTRICLCCRALFELSCGFYLGWCFSVVFFILLFCFTLCFAWIYLIRFVVCVCSFALWFGFVFYVSFI